MVYIRLIPWITLEIFSEVSVVISLIVIISASKEVADALYNYEAATDRIEIKEKEYNSYNTATEYSEELLTYGLANYLEVLTSRENTLNSRLDLINAKYSQLNSVVNLYQALGGGWQ